MSYKKVGGLHFVKLGRFGFSFFVSNKRNARSSRAKRIGTRAVAFECQMARLGLVG